MDAYYCDHFVLPLPEGHRFPMQKYALLRAFVQESRIVPQERLLVPEPATDEQILHAHLPEYLTKVQTGSLTDREIRRIGFPWSSQLVERSRRSSGGTIAACRSALRDGIAVNLAGGTHHAAADHGEGFCVFNDSVIAARTIQAERLARRVLVIDCDVHQGNGTASITHGDPTIFTFSIHGERNFPFRKFPSDLDIGLEDNTGDRSYLDLLEVGLQRALALSHADFAIYLAGADPYIGDRLGHLALSMDGLAARDRLVLEMCHDAGLPCAIVMAGGYAWNVEDIARIHLQTVRIAATLPRD